jgi:assimilatory nitrate reductase catalytic subunit
MHPADMSRLGLSDGGLARVESRHAATVLPVRSSTGQRPGEVFAPMHWTDHFTSAGPVDRIVSAATDPISGQPELKATPVRVTAVAAQWRGVLLRQSERLPSGSYYWARVPLANGHAFDLAGWEPLPSGSGSEAWVSALLGAPPTAELVIYADPGRGAFRYASLLAGRLEAGLFLARDAASLPRREALAALLGTTVEAAARTGLLAGPSIATAAIGDAGGTVCSCFSVGLRTLYRAIAERRLTTVGEIGTALRAGTNCGSCIPELKAILRDAGIGVAAA